MGKLAQWMDKLWRTAHGREDEPQVGGEVIPVQFGNNAPEINAYYNGVGYGQRLGMGAGGDGSKYLYGLSATGAAPWYDHRLMRANARSAYYDSLQARAVVERFADTVVDCGLRVECAPRADILGITEEQAEEWSRDVEQRFDMWASSKTASRAENLTYYQAQRMAETFQQRDGEYFLRLYYDKRDKSLLSPLQFSFIDPNQIMGDAYTSAYGFQQNLDGIERDRRGREIAYNVYILQNPQQPEWKAVRVPAKTRNGMPLMLHGYAPEYAGQGRGYSRIGHALQEFENMSDFTIAQIKKAIIQSSITMYVKPNEDSPASDPFENEVSGPGSAYRTPLDTDIDVPSSTTENPVVNYSTLNEAVIDPGSIGVFGLQGGEDLKSFDNTAPAESYASFVEAFTTELAASVSMPVEVLRMKFSENFSASRGALLMFWRVAMIWRKELASDMNDPVFETWLNLEIAAGRISAPGWSDPRMRAAWTNTNWIGPPMPNIDPSKTAKADQMFVEMGAKTLDMIAQQENGSSGSSNRAKLKKQIGELTPVPWSKFHSAPTSESDDKNTEDASGEE